MNEDEFREIMVDFDELILNDLTNNQVRDLYAVANNVFLDAQRKTNRSKGHSAIARDVKQN